jgi:acyl carrier protein
VTEPWDRGRIEDELRGILREHVRHPERDIQPGDHLIFDLEIDDDDLSFDVIPEIHRRFGIEPPARAWMTAATFADTVDLIERWQRAPMTPEERARDEDAELRRRRRMRRMGMAALAWVCIAVALEVWHRGVGVASSAIVMGILYLSMLPWQLREGRRLRRERTAWKARRAEAARG